MPIDLSPVPSWSASTIDNFNGCPYRYYEEKVTKRFVREWSGPAAEHGQYVHKRLEERLKSKRPLPDDLKDLERYCQELEGMGGKLMAEHQMAVNRQMQPTGWFAKDAWGRAAADVLVVNGSDAVVVDWKTGKVKFPELQSHILAFMTFIHFPEVTRIRTRFVFTKVAEEKGDEYSKASDAAWLAKEIVSHLQSMAHAHKHDAWPKLPTGLCGWCPVETCEHHR